MILDPSNLRATADLAEYDFLSGVQNSGWRIISFVFPAFDFAIGATEPDGKASEYGFKAELSNYPADAPLVRIWDHKADAPLAPILRPKGGARLQNVFQQWGSDTIYRPWERLTGPHNGNAARYPHLAWRSDRRLSFIFEDLHGILNSNARALRIQAAA